MLNKFLTKKTVLFLLLIIFFLLSFSNYIKTDDNPLAQFFEEEKAEDAEADSNENLMLQNNIKKETKMEEENLNNELSLKEKAENNKQEKPKRIASIEEIKDPFYIEENENAQNIELENGILDLKLDGSLRVLEKDITAVEAVDIKKEKSSKEKEEPSAATAASAGAGESKNNGAAAEKINLKKIELPFNLIGIVKSNNLASALFNYQGKTIIKNEKEKIDFFKIEKIDSKKVIISFEDQKFELKLWGVDQIEKQK